MTEVLVLPWAGEDDWDDWIESVEDMRLQHDAGGCPASCIFCEEEANITQNEPSP